MPKGMTARSGEPATSGASHRLRPSVELQHRAMIRSYVIKSGVGGYAMRIHLVAMLFALFAAAFGTQAETSAPEAPSAVTSAPGVSYTVWATGLDGPRGLLHNPAGGFWVIEEKAQLCQ